MSHATHANAALTFRARLRLARLIVDHDWSIPRAAERYDVSWKTARKSSDRSRSVTDWEWLPRPCTRCWCGAGSTG